MRFIVNQTVLCSIERRCATIIGTTPGGMLKRILTLVGSGSKSLKYFTFGPEYTFPVNCYSEKVEEAPAVFQEMQLGHHIIAKAEHVLWEARSGHTGYFCPHRSSY